MEGLEKEQLFMEKKRVIMGWKEGLTKALHKCLVCNLTQLLLPAESGIRSSNKKPGFKSTEVKERRA